MGALTGATAWLITDGKAGHEAQAEGVAEALGVAFEWRRVAPTGLARLLAPWGPAPRDFACTPPFPDIAIGVGRLAMPALRRLHRLAGTRTFTVALQDPRTPASIADLIWVPEHDFRRGPNVVTTLTAPHRFNAARLAELRVAPDAAIDALPQPRVMVAIGGPAKVWRYEAADIARLLAALERLAASGASLMVTTSRRTPPEVAAALRAITASGRHLVYDGVGDNPYARFLAKADAILVTADSVSMTGEAVATGRPVYVFRPSGGSDKFRRFHDALERAGATRLLEHDCGISCEWSHAPRDAAAEIARVIVARMDNRARYLQR